MPRTSGAPPGGRMCEQAVAEHRRVRKWLRRCLGPETELGSFRRLPGYSRCELVACETDRAAVVLKRYAPGFVDYSGLGPAGVARKHALVLQELPALGVPTPRLLGFAAQGKQAALAMEWIGSGPITSAGRLEAARILAQLHSISLAD